MRFFIDTANVEDIKKAHKMGILDGVTTNPSLVAKEGVDFHTRLREICEIVGDVSVSAEVIALDAEGMIREGKELAQIAPNITVKVPMTPAGLEAVAALSKEKIFNPNQALLAARACATYVSPFLGRLDDIGQDGMGLVETIAQIFVVHDIPTQIIAASVRNPVHVTNAALAGADIATIPFSVIESLTHHPLTTQGIEKFLADWEKTQQ